MYVCMYVYIYMYICIYRGEQKQTEAKGATTSVGLFNHVLVVLGTIITTTIIIIMIIIIIIIIIC